MSASPQAKSATERSVPDQPLAFDARERIEDFDWKGLEDSFHKEIDKCNKDEKKLYEELGNLVNYFNVWAESMNSYESERTAKRLKTRIRKVQLSEDELEQKRQHYIEVVRAFQSALELLNRS